MKRQNNYKKKNIINIHDMKALHYCIKKDTVAGCGYCEAIFEEDDFACALETGQCQYCQSVLMKVLVK